ncbi:MAG: type II CAAX prenyl endopeptidase Rce1 family protein, partial [Polyangiales bacterium]
MTEAPPRTSALRTLGVALLTCLIATVASYKLPDSVAGAGVGLVFLLATWVLVLRDRDVDARSWGLSLGGLLDGGSLSLRLTSLVSTEAVVFAAKVAAVVFPPFVVGFAYWNHVKHLGWAPAPSYADVVLSQLVVVALPEEAFFRGYLQTALDRAWPRRVRVLGADVGPSLVVTSLVFALGHLA